MPEDGEISIVDHVAKVHGGTYRGRSDLRTRWVETGAIWATGVRATF